MTSSVVTDRSGNADWNSSMTWRWPSRPGAWAGQRAVVDHVRREQVVDQLQLSVPQLFGPQSDDCLRRRLRTDAGLDGLLHPVLLTLGLAETMTEVTQASRTRHAHVCAEKLGQGFGHGHHGVVAGVELVIAPSLPASPLAKGANTVWAAGYPVEAR